MKRKLHIHCLKMNKTKQKDEEKQKNDYHFDTTCKYIRCTFKITEHKTNKYTQNQQTHQLLHTFTIN